MEKYKPLPYEQGRINALLVTYSQYMVSEWDDEAENFLDKFWGGLIGALKANTEPADVLWYFMVPAPPAPSLPNACLDLISASKSEETAMVPQNQELALQTKDNKDSLVARGQMIADFSSRVISKYIGEVPLHKNVIIQPLYQEVDMTQIAVEMEYGTKPVTNDSTINEPEDAPEYIQDYIYPCQVRTRKENMLVLVRPLYNYTGDQSQAAPLYVNESLALQLPFTFLRPTQLALTGGNLLFGKKEDNDYLLISEDIIALNKHITKLHPDKDPKKVLNCALAASFNIDPDCVYWEKSVFYNFKSIKNAKIFAHLDTYVSILGSFRYSLLKVRPTMLVGQISTDSVFYEKQNRYYKRESLPSFLADLPGILDEVAADISSLGFEVIRIALPIIVPIESPVMNGGTAPNLGGISILSYNNCLVELYKRNLSVYFPSYVSVDKNNEKAPIYNGMFSMKLDLKTDLRESYSIEFDDSGDIELDIAATLKGIEKNIENTIRGKLKGCRKHIDIHFADGCFAATSKDSGGSLHCLVKVLNRED